MEFLAYLWLLRLAAENIQLMAQLAYFLACLWIEMLEYPLNCAPARTAGVYITVDISRTNDNRTLF